VDFFEYKLNWIKYLDSAYRIRIGLDYTVKILDWVRIAKCSGQLNTISYIIASSASTYELFAIDGRFHQFFSGLRF